MREYAGFLTAANVTMIAFYVLIECTTMEFFNMVFVAFLSGFFAFCLFVFVTEPRKHKARWEKTGKDDELEVMTMGKIRR